MRAVTLLLTSCLVMASAMAQSDGKTSPLPQALEAQPQSDDAPLPADKRSQRIERIHHEDRGSSVNELRVGGETKSITVQPKVGNLPPYEVQPDSADNADGSAGRRVWRAIQF